MNHHAPSLAMLKSRRFRASQRAAGLCEIRLWLPDVTSPAFRALAERNSKALRGAPEETDAAAFIEAAMDGSCRR